LRNTSERNEPMTQVTGRDGYILNGRKLAALSLDRNDEQ
jgi:hypothetical protein